MGLKKKIVKSLIVWPPLAVAAGSLVLYLTVYGRDLGRVDGGLISLIVTAACSVGNVVYIVKS